MCKKKKKKIKLDEKNKSEMLIKTNKKQGMCNSTIFRRAELFQTLQIQEFFERSASYLQERKFYAKK